MLAKVVLVGWVGLVIVLSIHEHTQHDLLVVGNAGNGTRFFARLGEDREENGSENRDYRDDDEQFDECETEALLRRPFECMTVPPDRMVFRTGDVPTTA
jgi:hypothetical protein